MMKSKIINDPVHGFLSFPEPELMQLIDHPWFQRLRNISQMGVAHLVYPGAVHTRFLHSMGACHLMAKALEELQAKGFEISNEEKTAARIAILLHDIGHGPYSHALEHSLFVGIGHEHVSRVLMSKLASQFNMGLALQIFDGSYHKKFLCQLVSSQLDVDRLDYLSRDSFYSGVSEGVIGYDRILKMLTVRDNELAVEEKGIYSIEKFIIARHIMYWQVYLHKTVLGAEMLLVNILKRANELTVAGIRLPATESLQYFLSNNVTLNDLETNEDVVQHFCSLDDSDIILAIKSWTKSEDKILSLLCKMQLGRKLYKVVFDPENETELIVKHQNVLQQKFHFTEEELTYFVFSGTTSNSTYNATDSKISIALKDGTTRNLAAMKDSLVSDKLAQKVSKRYVCFTQIKD